MLHDMDAPKIVLRRHKNDGSIIPQSKVVKSKGNMKQNTILEQKELYCIDKDNRSSSTSSKRHVVLTGSLSKIDNESDCNESWDDTTLSTIETSDSTYQESSASSCSLSSSARNSADPEIELQAHPSKSKSLSSSQRTAKKLESKSRAIRQLSDFNSRGRKSELQSSRRKRLDMSRPTPRNYSRLLMDANYDVYTLHRLHRKRRRKRGRWNWEPSEPSKTASAIDHDHDPGLDPDRTSAKRLRPMPRVLMESRKATNANNDVPRVNQSTKSRRGTRSLWSWEPSKTASAIDQVQDSATAEGSRLQRQGSMESTNANNATNNCETANGSGIPSEDDTIEDEHQVEVSTLIDLGPIPDLGEDLGPCDRNIFSAPVSPVSVNTVEVNSKYTTITTKRTWENTFIDIRMESETKVFGIPVLKKQKCDTNYGATAVYPTKQHPPLTAGEQALKTFQENPRRCPDASNCGSISGRSTLPQEQHLSILASSSPINTKRSKGIMKPFYMAQNSQSIMPSTGITDFSPTAIVTPMTNEKKCIDLSIFLEKSEGREKWKQKLTRKDWDKLDSMDCLRNQTFDLEWEKDFGESSVKMDSSSHSLDSALLALPCAPERNTSEMEQLIVKQEAIKEMIVKHEMEFKVRKEILRTFEHDVPETVLSQVRTIRSSVP